MIPENKKAFSVGLIFLFCILISFVFYLKEDMFSFLLGALFSYLYMSLFFYSLQALFFKKRKKVAVVFLFGKWLFLLGVLILAESYLSVFSFAIGLGMAPALILSYLFNKKG